MKINIISEDASVAKVFLHEKCIAHVVTKLRADVNVFNDGSVHVALMDIGGREMETVWISCSSARVVQDDTKPIEERDQP